MILYRCFPWDRAAGARERGGALWFPRLLQGDGRHDNPLLYGCLYLSLREASPLVELLAAFRGRSLTQDKLWLGGLPLALAALELPDSVELLDLDDPKVLTREELRPSQVATGERAGTQRVAAELFERHRQAGGLRWWSTFEASWTNVTLFDRSARRLRLRKLSPLSLGDEVVGEAAGHLGLPISA